MKFSLNWIVYEATKYLIIIVIGLSIWAYQYLQLPTGNVVPPIKVGINFWYLWVIASIIAFGALSKKRLGIKSLKIIGQGWLLFSLLQLVFGTAIYLLFLFSLSHYQSIEFTQWVILAGEWLVVTLIPFFCLSFVTSMFLNGRT